MRPFKFSHPIPLPKTEDEGVEEAEYRIDLYKNDVKTHSIAFSSLYTNVWIEAAITEIAAEFCIFTRPKLKLMDFETEELKEAGGN